MANKASTETFEQVERHLYKRQYPNARGEWRTKFYAIFTDWKNTRRKFPAGDSLEDARDELGRLRSLNKGRHDWDKENDDLEKAKIKAMTLAEWLDKYLALVKNTPSGGTKKSQCTHLKRLLGHLPLSEVTRVRVMEYRNRRIDESLIRHGKAVAGTKIKGATVNRELSCLIHALNLAADSGLCDGAPRVTKEEETQRERILSAVEYASILDASPRWLQRVVIAANESAIDQGVLLKLGWDSIGDGLIAIKGGRAKTGARQRVGISPALGEVLAELRAEFRRMPNTDRRVFTKAGKPIPKATLRHAFDKAVQDAKVENFQFRDFRHCARTRWAAAGLPFEIGEVGIGHKIKGVASRYINLSDDQIRDAFRKMFPTCSQENRGATGEKRESSVSA
jgi:integrase